MEIFSPGHLIPLLIVAAILFFGWKQLPDMAKSVGKSLRIFKTEMKGMSDDDAARDAHKAEAIEPAPPAEKAPVPPADRPADDSDSESTKPSAD
ncbi:MAG TPA: twin-arginine translocase TatA/TatE family subunit [Jatrophihabitantaceae bacterium]|jgi:sec-independent protein translocase protein TatA